MYISRPAQTVLSAEMREADQEPVEQTFTRPEPQAAERLHHGDDVGVIADLVDDYLERVGKAASLNAEQEVALARRIEAGLFAREKLKAVDRMDVELKSELWWICQDGKEAKNDLLEASLRLVMPWAKLYTGRGVPFLDLIQEGNLALIHAVERFDYANGVTFPSFATWWIQRTLDGAVADQARTVKFTMMQEELYCILDTLSEHEAGVVSMRYGLTDGDPKTLAEIGKVFGLTSEQISHIHSMTIDKLRHPSRSRGLRSYLDA